MSSAPPHFNFAKAIGYSSVPAAVIFTILYVPLFGWFTLKSFSHPNYVHFVLTFFCAMRVAAFAIRAVLAGMESAGESLSLLIADEVLLGVGYFGLLYSAYTLVLDRELLNDSPRPRSPILQVTQNRRIFRLVLLVALVLGIVAASTTDNSGSSSSTSRTLHIASTVIFLALTVLQAFQTLLLARMEISAQRLYKQGNDSFGIKHGIHILVLISLLLLIREAFSTATMTNTRKQNNEHLWYPLIAVPEILAVILYSTPDLVPRRDELPK
ncbi:hypothetical protein B0H34DRAFT_692095 [Crassisporium funariophilum]|nr:hypothetical protein B0H34DRAFT_692095 [Crassisporium funariophilum]